MVAPDVTRVDYPPFFVQVAMRGFCPSGHPGGAIKRTDMSFEGELANLMYTRRRKAEHCGLSPQPVKGYTESFTVINIRNFPGPLSQSFPFPLPFLTSPACVKKKHVAMAGLDEKAA